MTISTDCLIELFNQLNLNKNDINDLINDMNRLKLENIFNKSNKHNYDNNLDIIIDSIKKLKLENTYVCAYHNSDQSICRIYDCFGHNHIIELLNYGYVN
jgi:hypothetical protein